MRTYVFLPFLIMSMSLSGCIIDNCVERKNCDRLTERGIILSFDDGMNLESWNESRDFFTQNEIIATFFIDRWGSLSEERLQIIRQLHSDGHEIGFHGLNHAGYFDFIAQNLSAQDYIEQEIIPGIELMEEQGYEINSYAYPKGQRNVEIDHLIHEKIPVLRGTRSNAEGSSNWLAVCEDQGVFRAISVGQFEKTKPLIFDALESVAENDDTLLIYGHGIEYGYYPISIEELTEIQNEVERLDIPWLKMSDLAT